MKKSWLPLILIAMLIVAMTSGSVALYSRTEALRGQLYTKIFLFKGYEKSTSYEFGLGGLALEPGQGEQELYRFSITNAQDASNISDYDMTVSIASSGMAAAASAMNGLTFYLYDVSSESGTPVATVSGGELSYGSVQFRAGTAKTLEYKITAKWADQGDSAAQTALAASGQSFPVKIVLTSSADI